MNEPYEEVLEGETCLRKPPGLRHEAICQRLHERVGAAMAGSTVARLLAPRSLIPLSADRQLRPDLALMTTGTNKLYLAVEVVSSEDHHADTVVKKGIYEDIVVPRLWMVDPRYDNVEVYHGGQYGLSLKQILAFREVLSEAALPQFQYVVAELFKA